MKRLIISVALLLMVFVVPAAATDGGTYDVKYMANNPQEVYNQIAATEFPDCGASISRAPEYITKDTTAYVTCNDEMRTVNIRVVMPTFEAQSIPSISADSAHNQSVQALMDYVYQYRVLKQTNPAYDAALGKAPVFELYKYNIGRDYDQYGKTYTLSQVYMEQQVTQRLVVNSVTASTPNVHIDSDGRVVCSPETVQYSQGRDSWYTIRNGSAIPSQYYGSYLYFRTPANSYMDASSSIKVYVKEQQSAPTAKIELASTSFSVSIVNTGDFRSGYEFSIDGSRYSSRTTWENLNANTNYTVYVRYAGDSKYFASSPVTASIRTKDGPKNEISYTKSSNAHTTYFVASGTTRLSLSGKTLSASYNESDVRRLKDDIKDASKRMSAVTVLDVLMDQEEGDTRDFSVVKFSMPKDMGLLQLRLATPYCTIITSDNSTSLEIESISKSVKTTGLKDFVAGKDLIYKVSTQGTGKIQILYPWEFPDRADLSGLSVVYTDAKFKNTESLQYQTVDNGILFTLPDDGYFSITNLHRDYGSLPFNDCQTHWAYSYIYYAYENGLVSGVSANQFSPDTKVTRSQIAVLLARLAGADFTKSYAHPFKDVDAGSWYEAAVGFLYQRGALKDSGDGMFNPDDTVTREQMAALVDAVFPYSGTIWRPMNCNDRDKISTFALTAVDGLFNRNVFVGDANGNFNPSGTITRGEFVTILYRLATSRNSL